MNELDMAIMKFFDMFSFGTPKELIDVIYPDFEKRYPDRNIFRIIVHRRLRQLHLKKLPLPGFYCHPKKEKEFYEYLRFNPQHLFNRVMIVYDVRQNKITEVYPLKKWYEAFEPLP
jgi:hypothetical protein